MSKKPAATPNKIEAELEKAAGFKKSKTESRAEFLKRLITSIANADDKVWAALSEDAKSFHNKNVDRLDAKEPLQDFPGYDEVEKDPAMERKTPAAVEAAPAPETPPAASTRRPAAKKKAAKKKVAKKKAATKRTVTAATAPTAAANGKGAPKDKGTAPAAAATKPAAEAANGKGKKGKKGASSLQAIRAAILRKPNISETEIHDQLKPKFPELALGTISTTRAGFRSALRMIAEKDMLKDSPGILAKLDSPVRRAPRANT